MDNVVVSAICGDINALIGASEEETKTFLKFQSYRIVSRDGVGYMLTADYRPDRLNLTINKGKIMEVYYG